jgi:hypothetical protein
MEQKYLIKVGDGSGYNGQSQLMSLELFNETMLISRKYSRQFLGKALELARFNGWRPMGTAHH